MNIGILQERQAEETRVAMVPALVSLLKRDGHTILLERGAGTQATFDDKQYQAAGAEILENSEDIFRKAEVFFHVQPPAESQVASMGEGTVSLGFLDPLGRPALIRALAERRITSYAMEYIPRITRAQSMDALSSMANIAGYKAVLVAAGSSAKMFPLLMTAAGTIHPATVLVLGAGVAGLQAIATARRLGAKVEAFDPRPAVKEQVKSLGAGFLDLPVTEEAETAGGYAREMSEDFLRLEREVIASHLPKADIVISTAQVFGKRAPVLISRSMVELLRAGSVIVDLAAENGGNCELTDGGTTVIHKGVSIIGAVNLPASLPADASQMYSRNVTNLFQYLYPKGKPAAEPTDEIVRGCCVTREGSLVHEAIRQALHQGESS
jgi:NAD(P) transhydrogenase subunit alpha